MAGFAGLLLAAGAGRRFGRPKALVSFAGSPLVTRGAGMLADGGCEPVLVVLGAAADEVLATADVTQARAIRNDDWASGLASSLRVGLAALPSEADAVVVALADQPLVGAPVIRALRAAFDGGAQLAVATYDGRRGNPVVLARAHWDGVARAARGDVGARDYLRQHAADVVQVDCTALGDPSDVDTPEDLAALEAR